MSEKAIWEYLKTLQPSEGGGGSGSVTGVKGDAENAYRTGNVNITAANVGALPNDTVIPSKTSDLTNDSGFISTETDPTVPSWAKASSKPSYTASEVGAVPTSRKVNGHALSSDVTITASDVGVEAGAEVNQNAFSNVKVGSTTISADTKTDTIEIEAGSNVTLTPDATNDKVTINATDTTYSVATTSASGLMSATDKSKLDTIEHYGVCDTNPATTEKTVTISGITELYTGLTVAVKFTGTNSIAFPTLNVNSLGAKAIKRYGTTAPSTSAAASWCAGSVVTLTYDGQYWQMHDWNNTTYTSMTTSEMEKGTATTGRVITATRLKEAVEHHAPVTSVAGLTGDVTLATVATSGSYNDLTNKPTLFSGDYHDLTNKPTIPTSISDLSNDMVYDLGAITVNDGQFAITSAQRTAIASMWQNGLCAITATVDGDTFYGIKERIITYSTLDFYGFVGASVELNASGNPTSGTFLIGICTTLDTGLCGDVKNLNSDDVETIINLNVSNFKSIAVSGQTSIQAGGADDTLTLSAGSGMSISTNSATKTITFSSNGGGGSGTSTPTADTLAEFDSTAHMNSTDMTASEVSDFVDRLDAQGANLYLWKTLSRTGISHPSGANYCGIATFPAKAGYTRKVGFFSSSNSSVAIVGYYFNGDTVILRTYNMSSSTVSVDLVCTAIYIRDDLVWS